MRASGGGPDTGPSARTLGVRPGVDIPIHRGRVRPATGGLSVAPDAPDRLPVHRRPARLGGTGKDPAWSLDLADLRIRLGFRQDKPDHGLLEPACEMTFDEFQDAIAATAPHWKCLS